MTYTHETNIPFNVFIGCANFFSFFFGVGYLWVLGGFGSYLLGLDKRTYEQAGIDTEGNLPGSFKEPGVGWMTGFLFVVSFVGLLALVPLRKVCSLARSFFICKGIVLVALRLICLSS